MATTTTTRTATVTPKIYVACLAAYNSGYLHGAWIEADQDPSDIQAEVNDMLTRSPVGSYAEEWAIHDYEGFQGWEPSEWESFETVAKVAEVLETHGPEFVAFMGAFGYGVEEAFSKFPDAFRGEWDSLEEYAREFVEEVGTIAQDSWAARYFDYEKLAREWDMSGEYVTTDAPGGGVFVFEARI